MTVSQLTFIIINSKALFIYDNFGTELWFDETLSMV